MRILNYPVWQINSEKQNTTKENSIDQPTLKLHGEQYFRIPALMQHGTIISYSRSRARIEE